MFGFVGRAASEAMSSAHCISDSMEGAGYRPERCWQSARSCDGLMPVAKAFRPG